MIASGIMPGMPRALIEKGWYVKGLTTGRGVVVVTTGSVAFVPTERPKHLAAELGWGAVGFVKRGATSIPPETIIDDLLAAEDMDERVAQLVEELGGTRWPRDEALLRERRVPLRWKRRGVWFVKGPESIRLVKAYPAQRLEELRPVLDAWPRAD